MQIRGIIIKGVGGLYTVRPDIDSERVVLCRARGIFKHNGIVPTVGDSVLVESDGADLCPDVEKDGGKEKRGGKASAAVDAVITDIMPRKSLLIRPPVANLDLIFVIVPTCRPAPDLGCTDKLLCIAEHADIAPAVVITKSELDPSEAARIGDIYRAVGFPVFTVSAVTGDGIAELIEHIRGAGHGALTAFAGVSGAGKSTLLNCIYPSLSLATGALSRKILRGKQTTRHVELYAADTNPLYGGALKAYVADTPGFSLLDFERFDFFTCEALPFTFREFEPYIGKCKYKKCTHLTEDGCAVVAAVRDGNIPGERHESYRELFAILKNKHPWD